MKNTCKLKLELNVNSEKKIAEILIQTEVDGEIKFIHQDNHFEGDFTKLVRLLSDAMNPIENDGRFGA